MAFYGFHTANVRKIIISQMYKAKKIDRYGEIWYRSDEDLG